MSLGVPGAASPFRPCHSSFLYGDHLSDWCISQVGHFKGVNGPLERMSIGLGRAPRSPSWASLMSLGEEP